jgi:nitroreductase / dihydropteridine reductase
MFKFVYSNNKNHNKMNLIELLNWRYATKKYTDKKVPQEKVDKILEAIRLTPTSAGLQAFTVLVIENEELKKKIQPIANNQPQIVDASHLLVFATWEKVTPDHLTEYMHLIASEREMPIESLDAFKANLTGAISRPHDAVYEWLSRQPYIALGTAIIAAAEQEVDATPMEGFNAAGLDELLNLKEKGLRSVAILALGYRDAANDYMVNAKKVRKPREQMFIEYK